MDFEIGDLVEMKPARESTWFSETKYYGLGLITKVGATTCAVDWIRTPWGGVEQLRGIDKELLRRVE
jgi:hypothetical protein